MWKWLLLLGVIAGCHRPSQDWQGVVDIRPVVFTENGETGWTDDAIKAQIDAANVYWRATGVSFRMLDPVYQEYPHLARIDGLGEWSHILALANQGALGGEFMVHFVRSIVWSAGEAGGMAGHPAFPFPYQYGAIISEVNAKAQITLAHELGHAWGCSHPAGYDRCVVREMACRVMSYCFPRQDECEPEEFFSPEEIAAIRWWCAQPSRSRVTRTTRGELKVASIRRAARVTSTQPSVDYVDDWRQ